MKVKRTSPELEAYYYDGQYASYLDIFNAIKRFSKASTLTTWERDVPIYYFNPFLNQKVRFVEGEYIVIEKGEYSHDILLTALYKEAFEEQYEILEQ